MIEFVKALNVRSYMRMEIEGALNGLTFFIEESFAKQQKKQVVIYVYGVNKVSDVD